MDHLPVQAMIQGPEPTEDDLVPLPVPPLVLARIPVMDAAIVTLTPVVIPLRQGGVGMEECQQNNSRDVPDHDGS